MKNFGPSSNDDVICQLKDISEKLSIIQTDISSTKNISNITKYVTTLMKTTENDSGSITENNDSQKSNNIIGQISYGLISVVSIYFLYKIFF